MSCSVNSSVSSRSRGDAVEQADRVARLGCADMPAVGSSSSSSSDRWPARCRARAASGCRATASRRSRPAWSARPSELRAAPRSRRDTAARRGSRNCAPAAMGEQRGLHVLEHGELGEDVGALERAADAHAADRVRRDAGDVAALERARCPLSGSQVAGDQIEQGRLAGAVRADHGGDLPALGTARLTPPTAVKPANDLADVARPQASRAASASRAAPAPAEAPTMPPGNTNSRTSRIEPRMNGQYCGVGGDLLVEQDQHGGADGRAPEVPMPPRIAMIRTSADFAQ